MCKAKGQKTSKHCSRILLHWSPSPSPPLVMCLKCQTVTIHLKIQDLPTYVQVKIRATVQRAVLHCEGDAARGMLLLTAGVRNPFSTGCRTKRPAEDRKGSGCRMVTPPPPPSLAEPWKSGTPEQTHFRRAVRLPVTVLRPHAGDGGLETETTRECPLQWT